MTDTSHTLSELGLNKIQVKILLTLCKFDCMSVKDLSKETGTHRAQIYTALEELETCGLIEKEIGKPIQYRAIPMSKVLDILLDRKIVWMSELQVETKDLIKKVSGRETRAKKEQMDDYSFNLINGPENVASTFQRWIENSKTVDFVLDFKRHPNYIEAPFRDFLCKFKEDVTVRIVTGAHPEGMDLAYWKGVKNIEIRFVPFDVPMEIGVFNKERASLTIFTKKTDRVKTEMSALTSNHPFFVQMVQNHFDLLWNSSTSALQDANGTSVK